MSKNTYGNMGGRQELIDQYSWLIARVARRAGSNLDANMDELMSVSTIGFMKAVNSFDAARHGDFAAYSVNRMVSEIALYLHNKGIKE